MYRPGSAASANADIRISASCMSSLFFSVSSNPYDIRMIMAPKKLCAVHSRSAHNPTSEKCYALLDVALEATWGVAEFPEQNKGLLVEDGVGFR